MPLLGVMQTKNDTANAALGKGNVDKGLAERQDEHGEEQQTTNQIAADVGTGGDTSHIHVTPQSPLETALG